MSSAVTDDELLYSQAMEETDNGDYVTAISDLKDVIDNYPGAMYVSFAVSSLYDMYVNLDSTNNQNTKDLLYGNLKTYLNDKILGQYSEDLFFVPAAYNVVLMCETNMKDFDAALDGYDFIATYNPDAEVRLMASWDYAAVEDIAGSLGNGGGEKTNENCIKEKFPVQRKVKDVYDNVSNSKKSDLKIPNNNLIKSEAKKI